MQNEATLRIEKTNPFKANFRCRLACHVVGFASRDNRGLDLDVSRQAVYKALNSG
jgi:hypothetical protein